MSMIWDKWVSSLRQRESQGDARRVEGSRWDIVHVHKQIVGDTENLGYRKAHSKDFLKCLIPDFSGTFSITASKDICTDFWLCCLRRPHQEMASGAGERDRSIGKQEGLTTQRALWPGGKQGMWMLAIA